VSNVVVSTAVLAIEEPTVCCHRHSHPSAAATSSAGPSRKTNTITITSTTAAATITSSFSTTSQYWWLRAAVQEAKLEKLQREARNRCHLRRNVAMLLGHGGPVLPQELPQGCGGHLPHPAPAACDEQEVFGHPGGHHEQGQEALNESLNTHGQVVLAKDAVPYAMELPVGRQIKVLGCEAQVH
jgi:hypothetical protein